MSWKLPAGFALFALLVSAGASAQQPSNQPDPSPTSPIAAASLSPVPLEWVPPALDQLNTLAVTKSSFTLDRNMLSAAAALVPDSEVQDRVVIRKLEGVSVHTMRFNADGIPDQSAVDSIRSAYHLRGWKHVVTTTSAGGPLRNGTTDVWVVMDGVNVRGAVVLSETPRSLTLVTVAGNLDPVDILHLRGHFGIPAFDSSALGSSHLQ